MPAEDVFLYTVCHIEKLSLMMLCDFFWCIYLGMNSMQSKLFHSVSRFNSDVLVIKTLYVLRLFGIIRFNRSFYLVLFLKIQIKYLIGFKKNYRKAKITFFFSLVKTYQFCRMIRKSLKFTWIHSGKKKSLQFDRITVNFFLYFFANWEKRGHFTSIAAFIFGNFKENRTKKFL